MKTFIICLFALGIRRVKADGCTALPTVCFFEGTLRWHTYKINSLDFQNELHFCNIISYSGYYFDLNENQGHHVDADTLAALQLLMDNNKPVYIRVTFINSENWKLILDPKYEKTSSLEIDALVNFLNTYKIAGIILEDVLSYGLYAAPRTVENIIAFTNKMKAKISTLLVGLYLDGQDADNFPNNAAFDFKATNKVLDLYFIDMTLSNPCGTQIVQKYGVNPIYPIAGQPLFTLAQQCNGVKKSSMNICKVYIVLQVSAAESNDDAVSNGDPYLYGSYSQICYNASKNINIKRWCLDSLSTIYQQAKFVRSQNFINLNVEIVDGDDTNGACECGRFPISKALISGWNSGVMPKCARIAELDYQNQK